MSAKKHRAVDYVRNKKGGAVEVHDLVSIISLLVADISVGSAAVSQEGDTCRPNRRQHSLPLHLNDISKP